MTSDSSSRPFIERWTRALGMPDLAARLAERLSPSELTSLLLDVRRRQAKRRTPADVLAEYERGRFSRPSHVPPRRLARFESLAFTHLPAAFELVVLSPVCPLGTSSVVAGVTQDWAVATDRGGEVVSDATNVLALEVASRRRVLLRDDPRSPRAVHLAAHHRLVRPQFFRGPRQTSHFALLALVSGARAGGGSAVEFELVALHLAAQLSVIRAVVGGDVPLRVVLSDFSGRDRAEGMRERIVAPLRRTFENVTFQEDFARQGGRGYYAGVAFHVYGRASEEDVFLVDGGEVSWGARLLSNEKERTVISGLGSERLCDVFLQD